MPTSNHHVRERQRLDFAKIHGTIQIPNLIEVQMKSYQRFLQMDLLPSERDDGGLQSVFTSVFPIRDFREMSQLDFAHAEVNRWQLARRRAGGSQRAAERDVAVADHGVQDHVRLGFEDSPYHPGDFSALGQEVLLPGDLAAKYGEFVP